MVVMKKKIHAVQASGSVRRLTIVGKYVANTCALATSIAIRLKMRLLHAPVLISLVAGADLWNDDMQEFAIGDIPEEWVPYASTNICDFQGRWQLMLEESDTLDSILTGLQFGWFKKKALRNFAPTTFIKMTDESCYANREQYEDALSLVEPFIPEDGDEVFAESIHTLETDDGEAVIHWDDLDKIDLQLVGMGTQAETGYRDPPLYMHMKTLFPWHNVKEGVVSVDGPPFEHKDSDTGAWRSAVTFKNGRIYQKRTSAEYGNMYDIRAIFVPRATESVLASSLTPESAAADAAAEDETAFGLDLVSEATSATANGEEMEGEAAARDGLDPRTWQGEPLMLFKWTLVGHDGQVYQAVRWNRKVSASADD
ncbi:hypothetical protein GNI_029440 [Gregarina niphandrodes]|uniref:Uncharacterized protein n=1 Tax=Gregarina niphandrodes TaxID=110365 RepID=A0A023BB21_GRENI|nr:hypothetical protein GNI_029440 [Gregarina niphandrodes]EZG79100.1 hypothetical protein GNI_029440 [Gregarina niphandrodes]|eukprot:XP_011129132.1 hypothetical protein GNI_029440 [Gregarina niphandrodes]